ncbi:MAG: hypothetical protein HOV79_29695 [Hamadaea sp.]|nr:hypothetical protein [Hamadaea sp.]
METQDDRHSAVPTQPGAPADQEPDPSDEPPGGWSDTEKRLWRAFREGTGLDLCPGWRRLQPVQSQHLTRLALLPSGTSLADRSAGLGAEFGARGRRHHTYAPETYAPERPVSPAAISNGGLYYTAAKHWWDAQSTVRAEVVRQLLIDGPAAEPGRIRRLVADGLRVEGRLDLQDAEVAAPIELRNCDFAEPVDLSHARLGRVSLAGSSAPALTALDVRVDGPLDLAEAKLASGIQLAGGEIGGRLDLTRAILGEQPRRTDDAEDEAQPGPERKVLLNARHVRVGGETILEGAIISGDVDLTFAAVGGDLSLGAARIVGRLQAGSAEITGSVCTTGVGDVNNPMEVDGSLDLSTSIVHKSVILPGSRLSAQDGWALNLSSATVEESVHLDQATINGGLNIFNTMIGEDLSITDAMITQPTGGSIAVYGYGVQVNHDIDMYRATVRGGTLLDNGTVTGDLNCDGATLSNPGGVAFIASNCRAGALRSASAPMVVEGDVHLISSQFERMVDLRRLQIKAATPPPSPQPEEEPEAAKTPVPVSGAAATSADAPPDAEVPAGPPPALGALIAPGLIAGQLVLERLEATGPVDLRGAQIRGEISLYAARAAQIAIEGASVNGWIDARMVTADGLSAHGLRAGSNVFLSGAQLRGDEYALNLGQCTIAGSVFANAGPDEEGVEQRFEAVGGVYLGGAQVERDVDFSRSSLDAGPAGPQRREMRALDVSNCAIKGSLTLRDASVSGAIDFIVGAVGLDIDLAGARLVARDEPEYALYFSSCSATRLFLNLDKSSRGSVTLRDTRVIRVDFDEWAWPAEMRLDLDSFSFQWWRTIEEPTPPPDAPAAAAESGTGRRRRSGWELEERRLQARLALLERIPFSPWAYEQLAQFYRGQGKQREAERVLYARLRRFYRRQPLLSRQWGNLQRVFSGYGYRSQHAVGWFVGALIAGTAYFSAHPLTSSTNHDNTVDFDPMLYTLDRMIPLVDLGQENAWNVSSWLGDKGVSTVLMVLGWVLTATVIAGASRVIRRG